MQLQRALLHGVGPFERTLLPFADDEGRPRRVTVIHGGGGVGKTTLLAAIASTRPGHATVQAPRQESRAGRDTESAPYAVCDWILGLDDPERPHPLVVASPNVKIGSSDEEEMLRRREQALFDRVAGEGGFAFLSIGSTRWFSRQPIVLSAPARSTARYDVRQAAALDDASRSDLARETKQALAYAAIAGALAAVPDPERRFDRLDEAMRAVTGELCSLSGFSYAGLDPHSFEPSFTTSSGRVSQFDALPTRVRHLAAFAALSVRTLWAAYPDRDPRTAEGVVMIDDVDLHQDASVQARLVPALRRALPLVQWILTSTSPVIAQSCDVREVLALRLLPERDIVTVFSGQEALTH